MMIQTSFFSNNYNVSLDIKVEHFIHLLHFLLQKVYKI